MSHEHRKSRRTTLEQCRVRTGAFDVRGLQERAEGDGLPDIIGYAAVFDTQTELWSGTTEEIAPGAFARSLKEGNDVRALVNHDPSQVLGRSKAGTLSLKEDKKGLRIRITPPDTNVGRDIVESIRRGDVDQMSFAFRIVREEAEYDDDGAHYRLLDLDLVDISVVTFPQYEETVATLDEFRSLGKLSVSVPAKASRAVKPQESKTPTPKMDTWKRRLAEAGLTKTPDVI